MDKNVYISKLLKLSRQKDYLLPAVVILSACQLLSLFLIMHKKERIVIVPPVVSQPFWVDDYAVSPTYLEQMGSLMGSLLLSNSAESLSAHREMILRLVHPSGYTTIRQYLIGEEEHLKKHHGNYHFHVQETKLNVPKHTIVLTGTRESYVSGKCVDQAKESYIFRFKFYNGRYLLVSCEKEEKSQ